MERVQKISDLRENKIPDNLPETLKNIIKLCVTNIKSDRYNIEELYNVINNVTNKINVNNNLSEKEFLSIF